ncbi:MULTISPECIES: tetratricopeptide repeat protein [Pasteurellaceae]|uniref:Tetratricopeptide repeat protein n=1 Tax=Pasteurella atlantica TaxID=2827233 RepID=A0AAW8CRA0_9PAST|nr:tetratricopeptide repeat protein [Pasteurella atlantica]MBR0574011.1 sel1 repeat family protein [Pasteurella atlantica]MDP8039973.1 tetratricopeptide repeat protein [Pasteurella atlantica]MDP8042087.1 tetratricopeptide repeat protein [Pasteurella atlantica]MDP8044277.1 tetratricopeptide repeat protein [Pasteurella atlantica]MDP8046286.1 tetratricopeptide repeat protein [Pasteurella atlantica]
MKKLISIIIGILIFSFSSLSYANKKHDDQVYEFYEIAKKHYDKKQYKQAFKLFKKIAEQNDKDPLGKAQYYLGKMYAKGLGVKRNYTEAIKWYKVAATGYNYFGFPAYELGIMYRYGIGVKQDNSQAFKWFLKTSDRIGFIGGLELGSMYENGLGTEQNYGKALKIYEQAHKSSLIKEDKTLIEQKKRSLFDKIIKLNDAIDYYEKKQYKKALKLFTESAEQGSQLAQITIADMYRKGLGTKKDFKQTEKWYKIAAKSGNKKAQKILEDKGIKY